MCELCHGPSAWRATSWLVLIAVLLHDKFLIRGCQVDNSRRFRAKYQPLATLGASELGIPAAPTGRQETLEPPIHGLGLVFPFLIVDSPSL